MTWSEGYHVAETYTDGYYAELSPARIDTALRLAGRAALPAGPCCELGFGQGTSLVLHAAAHPDREFFGNDFLPAHVSGARSLAAAAGFQVRLSEASFEEYCTDKQLPQFALIVAHGIWSWVSAENRARILDFVRRKLMPGGVFHVSYNLKSGWLGAEPLRDLLYSYFHRMQAPSTPTATKVERALSFAQSLMDLSPAAAQAAPAMRARLEHLKTQDPQYLAHEYFNADWHLTSFSEVWQQFQQAKLSYATSALVSDHIQEIQVTAEQAEHLGQISDSVLRQSARDLFSGQAFRRDLWVKGSNQLPEPEFDRAWREWRVVPIAQQRPGTAISVKGWAGEAQVPLEATDKLLSYLHGAEQSVPVQRLIHDLKIAEGQWPHLRRVLRLLMASHHIDIARDDGVADAARAQCGAINATLLDRANRHKTSAPMASPVTGVGLNLPHGLVKLLAAHAPSVAEGKSQQATVRLESVTALEAGKPGSLSSSSGEVQAAAVQGQELQTIFPMLKRLGLIA